MRLFDLRRIPFHTRFKGLDLSCRPVAEKGLGPVTKRLFRSVVGGSYFLHPQEHDDDTGDLLSPGPGWVMGGRVASV